MPNIDEPRCWPHQTKHRCFVPSTTRLLTGQCIAEPCRTSQDLALPHTSPNTATHYITEPSCLPDNAGHYPTKHDPTRQPTSPHRTVQSLALQDQARLPAPPYRTEPHCAIPRCLPNTATHYITEPSCYPDRIGHCRTSLRHTTLLTVQVHTRQEQTGPSQDTPRSKP